MLGLTLSSLLPSPLQYQASRLARLALIAKQLGGASHPATVTAAAALSEGLAPWLEGKNADPLVRVYN
jgi:hypothetical protein